jgi:DNA/RNA-binding domain of Phe-tRNA-synthetase-like protein
MDNLCRNINICLSEGLICRVIKFRKTATTNIMRNVTEALCIIEVIQPKLTNVTPVVTM